MTETRVIRYRTSLECADENARLIEAVFAELEQRDVPALRYEVFRLDDGVTFVHIATLDSEKNPLETTLAFAAFQSGMGERLEEGPFPARATVVGSHGFR